MSEENEIMIGKIIVITSSKTIKHIGFCGGINTLVKNE